ncbi:diphosphomevalonate decarboxylase [Streptomyces sp. NPDC056144]|uniref:diphosphomevalonate decarboxylase n=1 Tax=unclassified Streptomyces TaxID=2593676 RepID=UPI0035E14AE3
MTETETLSDIATDVVTAVAPANIALIKYWGVRDEAAVLPANPSLSMTLDTCVSRCTARRLDGGVDEIWWRTADGETGPAPQPVADGIRRHLARLREPGGPPLRIVTGNTFPTAAGIASSASGFTALTLAVTTLLDGRRPEPDRLSVLSRLSGSGSAARSAYGGYVRWPATPEDPAGPAAQVAPADSFPLCDVIAVVDDRPKGTSSREGHRRALTSPYFARRLELLPERTAVVEQALRERDFTRLAEAVETEAVDLHLIAMSASPATFYWRPATLAVLAAVRALRDGGIDACATIDAGPNVHVLTTPERVDEVRRAVGAVPGVLRTLTDAAGDGPCLSDGHLEAPGAV